MIWQRFLAAIFFSLILSATSQAHPGGHSFGPPASKEEIKKSVPDIIGKLIDSGKLDKSWKEVPAGNPEQKDLGGVQGWVVATKNAKATEKDKQTLYIFFAPNGQPLGANFTGK